ncbi:uncharacterized protein LOC107225067 [Neodiprion lecontei]|uniref:glutathione transferase n=2 Tax=Neodiprion TaxID=270857 RepID=A0ABM3G4M4_NEOLC|nr:uncharacterized protein LOC107225067 [Neodiprion lecontei]
MSGYKLTYFGIAGLAEPIRYLLSYGGIDFEDNRITQEAWPALKPQMPLEQVPVLEVDGKFLYQSNAIARFLAKKFNLLGSNDLEAFDVDATLETIGDLRQLLAKWYWYSEPAQKAATEAETKKKAAFYLGKLDAWVKKNDGYFVAGKLSAADIVFAGFHIIFAFLLGKDYLADYPNLKGVIEKVEALPAIKAYIAKRPVTEYTTLLYNGDLPKFDRISCEHRARPERLQEPESYHSSKSTMSNYKLTYFNLAGLGEPIRFLLSYGGVKFEDKRITHDIWPQFKSQTPLEQLPILEVDGKTLYQSNPIARFLAKKFNLFGSSDFEAFEVDATLETISDLRQVLAKYGFADAAQKSATEAETFQKVAFYLGKFEATVKKNGGYFVGGKLTAADIVFAGFSNFLSYLAGKDILVGYPSLKSLVDKVVSQPSIKAYIAKRPKTDF